MTALPNLAAHNLYEATYDADGNITEMVLLDDTATGGYNTDAYESAGYAMLTVDAGDPAQQFIENGTRTLRFPTAANNNRYILLAPDCLFFVNGMDDGNGDYEVYSSMSAALTALGTNAAGQHLLTASASTDAKFVAFTNSNGQATAIIFYDRAYEDVSTPGGGGGGEMTLSNVSIGGASRRAASGYSDVEDAIANATTLYLSAGQLIADVSFRVATTDASAVAVYGGFKVFGTVADAEAFATGDADHANTPANGVLSDTVSESSVSLGNGNVILIRANDSTGDATGSGNLTWFAYIISEQA